jgi:hypothetical protein
MGTWAKDPFGNDTACDWKYDVEKSNGFQLIEKTLQKVLSIGDGYLDSSEADEAIAAADTVARLRGHFGVRNAYTESLDKWVAQQNLQIPQGLVDSAIQVVERVTTEPSELLELWQESGEFDEWKAEMDELKERLERPFAT